MNIFLINSVDLLLCVIVSIMNITSLRSTKSFEQQCLFVCGYVLLNRGEVVVYNTMCLLNLKMMAVDGNSSEAM